MLLPRYALIYCRNERFNGDVVSNLRQERGEREAFVMPYGVRDGIPSGSTGKLYQTYGRSKPLPYGVLGMPATFSLFYKNPFHSPPLEAIILLPTAASGSSVRRFLSEKYPGRLQ